MPSYRYKEEWDGDMVAFLEAVESRQNTSGSEDPEIEFWLFLDEIVAAKLDQLRTKESHGAFLDAGCGMGRVTLRYGPQFRTCVALDPDKERLDITAQAASSPNNDGRLDHVQFVSCFAQDYVPPTGVVFDIIVCNHVIQHTPTDITPDILKNFHSLLAEDGILVCSTTNSCELGFEAHTSESQQIVSHKEFDELANGIRSEALGVQWYTQLQLSTILQDALFEQLNWKGYTFYTPSAVALGNVHPLLMQDHISKDTILDTAVSQVVSCRKMKIVRARI
jgi:2-polyprenyl-3-methyl-5-hydroxy-6-metoxy-1,4-benzoquinol methylase